jgi:hypothetical protein
MSNEITTLGKLNLQKSSGEDFDKIAKVGDWLPRVQLFGGNSKDCKAGRIGIGRYGFVKSKDSIVDLGPEFSGLVFCWRPRAMEVKNDDVTSFFDTAQADFKRIMAESELEDSGCFYGPEFLIWVPQVKSLATLFCNSKTMRSEAPNLKGIIEGDKKAFTAKVKFIEKGKYSWHGPVFLNCTTPVQPLPDMKMLTEEAGKFNDPPKEEKEKAKPEQTRAR